MHIHLWKVGWNQHWHVQTHTLTFQQWCVTNMFEVVCASFWGDILCVNFNRILTTSFPFYMKVEKVIDAFIRVKPNRKRTRNQFIYFVAQSSVYHTSIQSDTGYNDRQYFRNLQINSKCKSNECTISEYWYSHLKDNLWFVAFLMPGNCSKSLCSCNRKI